MQPQVKGALRSPEVLFAPTVCARDIAAHGGIEVLGAGDWTSAVIRRDGCGSVDFDNGISLHFARETHLAHLETAATLRPCLSVKLFLEGSVQVDIDSLRLPMPTALPGGGWQAMGVIVAHRAPARFRRVACKGSHLVKVIVDVPHDWLDRRLRPDRDTGLAGLLGAGLAVVPWHPGPSDIAGARRLFALNAAGDEPLAEILMEGAALAMVASALRALHAAAPVPAAGPGRADPRAERFRALVAGLPGGPADVAGLARSLAVSPATLQRLCQQAFGCTVQAYIRTHRLHAAHAALLAGHDNLARIAWQAGYGSTANFATAFGRAFGCRPTDIRRGTAAPCDALSRLADCRGV